ncbi:MAG TPA: Trm112 family protein [Candidatus Acidoferrum sp.]|nr:Trm112 family protein [Candidatus Acidoferrum sp.]
MELSPELLAILVCPESKEPLVHLPPGTDGPGEYLYCPASRLKYRVDDGIPVMLVEEAERLDESAAEALSRRLAAR